MFSVRGWREDLVAVVTDVRSPEAVDASRVVLIRMSLGGALILGIAGYLYARSRQRES